jgi:hypothetical protein
MRITTLLPTTLVAVTYLLACDDPEPLAPTSGSPAQASAQAAVTQFEEPYAFELSCPQGFVITNIGVASGHQLLLPAGGTPQTSEIHFSLRGTLTNTTSGRTLRNDADFTIFADLSTGEITASGGGFHVVAIGQGIVVLDVGTIRLDDQGQVTFEAGRHDFYNGDFEALECEALS